MRLEEAINETRKAIDHIYVQSEASNIARYYFEDAMGISNLNTELNAEQIAKWEQDKTKLNNGEPLQYVVGVSHFYGHQFLVNSNVLIPRPETEELVRQCIQILKTIDRPASVLDIGTGSGCIPISIKLERPSTTKMTSIDVSRAALTVAIDNSQLLDAHVQFKEANVLDDEDCNCLDRYDIIVSNPPYIPLKEKDVMPTWVKEHEPELALFVDDKDPLLFYRRILDISDQYLSSDGYILFEVNEFNAHEVEALAKSVRPKAEIDILQDLQGKDRILVIAC